MTENNFEEWPTYRKKPGKIKRNVTAIGLAASITAGGYAGIKALDHYNEPHGTPY